MLQQAIKLAAKNSRTPLSLRKIAIEHIAGRLSEDAMLAQLPKLCPDTQRLFLKKSTSLRQLLEMAPHLHAATFIEFIEDIFHQVDPTLLEKVTAASGQNLDTVEKKIKVLFPAFLGKIWDEAIEDIKRREWDRKEIKRQARHHCFWNKDAFPKARQLKRLLADHLPLASADYKKKIDAKWKMEKLKAGCCLLLRSKGMKIALIAFNTIATQAILMTAAFSISATLTSMISFALFATPTSPALIALAFVSRLYLVRITMGALLFY